MIKDVKSALRAIVGSAVSLRHSAGPGRAFELYVMTGIARALKARGYEVWIQRSDGSRVKPGDRERRFVQRGGAPTGVAHAALGPGNASTIVFRRCGCPAWELLNGVQFRGRSSAFHEIDIALVPAAVASALRNSGGGRPLGRPRISIECKDVGTSGTVDEMRAFVARMYDLTILSSHHRYLVRNLGVAGPPSAIHPDPPPGPTHPPVVTYWNENRRTFNVLARRTGFARGTAALAGYHAVAQHPGIRVGSASATQLMDDVADWIRRRGYGSCHADDDMPPVDLGHDGH